MKFRLATKLSNEQQQMFLKILNFIHLKLVIHDCRH